MPEWYKKRILQKPGQETQSITERPGEFYQLNLPDFRIPTIVNPEDSIITGLANRKWKDIWEHKGKASGINNTDVSLQEEHPSLFLLPFAPEVMGSGLGLGVLKTLGGYAGSYVGSKIGNEVGYALDNTFNKQLFEPLGEIVGGFAGFGKGYNLFGKVGIQGTLKYLSNTGKDVPRWFMRPELRTNIGRVNQKTFFAEDQTPKYNPNQLPGLNRRLYQSPLTSQFEMVPQTAFASDFGKVEDLEKLVGDFPTTGEGNIDLWKKAGIDVSQFPSNLAVDLQKMINHRTAVARRGLTDKIINVVDGHNIQSYFNTGLKDNRLGYVDLEDVGKDLGFSYIKKLQSMSNLGLDPYTAIGTNAAKQYSDVLGKRLISGRELLNPKATIQHIDYYFKTDPVLQKIKNGIFGKPYFAPIPGKYHETDLKERIARQWTQLHPGKVISDRELQYLEAKELEKGTTASEDGYLNVSSFPEYFDKSGHFRTDLPQDLIDELSTRLSEGIPGFYQSYIGPLKRPLIIPNQIISPFIHPNVYLDPLHEHPNLGIFSTFEKK